MKNSRVNIAIVGLGFDAEFMSIYQKHPHANMYGICQRSESAMEGGAFKQLPVFTLSAT